MESDTKLSCFDSDDCDEPNDGCWCDFIKILKKENSAETEFMLRNINIINPNKKVYRTKVKASKDINQPEKLNLVIDFWSNSSKPDRIVRKGIYLNYTHNGIKYSRKAIGKLNEVNFEIKMDHGTLPDTFDIEYEFGTYQTSQLNCPWHEGPILKFKKCTKDQPCWCLLIDQIRVKQCGGVRFPLTRKSSTYASNDYLEIVAQLDQDDPDFKTLFLNLEIKSHYFTGYNSKLNGLDDQEKFYAKYVIE